MRLRLGFNAIWLVGVAASNDQVDFNLHGTDTVNPQSVPHGHSSNNGSMLYFGPQIEMQFFF